jgi:DNA-binding HxlR family transcriptional regulator
VVTYNHMDTIFDTNCDSRAIFEDLSKKWTIIVIMLLHDKPLRFGELLKRTTGISQKMLTQTLRTLQHNGLIYREVNPTTVPITVTYSLTALGESFVPALVMMRDWIERHRDEILRAQKVV